MYLNTPNNLNRLLHPENRVYTIGFLALTLVYLRGLFVDIYGVDATQYASISLEMLTTGEWLEVHHRGEDYLDKPPLHFWLSALSFKILGVSNFAYKLPSFLITILGAYSTYRLGRLWYGREAGRTAALILYSSLGIMLINQDVRTDTIMIGLIAFSCWQLVAFQQSGKWMNLIGAFVGMGLAMLTKGPLGLVLPAAALFTDAALKRDWKSLFRWEWLVGIGIIGVILFPMCWGLYHQWDLHPEKELYGKSDISGLKFFFWDQSFGRLTGDNPFINELKPQQGNDPTFFIHTTLWSFLPWMIILCGAVVVHIRKLIRTRFRLKATEEGFTLGAFIIPLIAVSLSDYKLPHYIYPSFPFLAIIIGNWLHTTDTGKGLFNAQQITGFMLLTGAMSLLIWSFPTQSMVVWLIPAIACCWLVALYIKWIQNVRKALLMSGVLTAIGMNWVLNAHFYPSLAEYEAGIHAARWAKEEGVENDNIYLYKTSYHAFEFYHGHIVESKETMDEPGYYLLKEEDLPTELPLNAQIVEKWDYHNPTVLTMPFLKSASRQQHVQDLLFVRIDQ